MSKNFWITGIVIIGVAGSAIIAFLPNLFAAKGIKEAHWVKGLLVGHRGGADLGYENTLSCIEKGIEAGADMIEIDIHLTKDGKLLVCHDQTVNRTTNGKGKIRDLTLQEIRQFKVVDKKGNLTEEHLPTLGEVLQLVNGRVKLLIEIKRTQNIYQGIEQELLDEIAAYQANSWVVVQSFNDSVLEKLRQLNDTIRLEKLFIFKVPGLPYIFDGTFTRFNYEKYAYISSFNIYYWSASASLIADIHQHQKEVKIWTLSGPESAPDVPVDGVITNRPDLWKR